MLVSENEIPPSALAMTRRELLQRLHGLHGPKYRTICLPWYYSHSTLLVGPAVIRSAGSHDHLPVDGVRMHLHYVYLAGAR
jgi:hypothetical protein